MVMLHVPVTGTGMELIVKVINFICCLLETHGETAEKLRMFSNNLFSPNLQVVSKIF
jgi:hypothetical protein